MPGTKKPVTPTIIAIGGNALIGRGKSGTIAEQRAHAKSLADELISLHTAQTPLVVTHGNGPQVGFILLRSEMVADSAPVPRLPLDLCVADSQGGIGYILAAAFASALGEAGRTETPVCLLTHVVVDRSDPAFASPQKPIGPQFDEKAAASYAQRFGWTVAEDSGRGFRRVVPSPEPKRILEASAIALLSAQGSLIIAGGGGGIPMIELASGGYEGVEAVCDKDLTSALLAESIGAKTLVLCTGIDRVWLRYGQPDAAPLDRLIASEADKYLAAGEFPPGSMGPKIEACLRFLASGGERALITSPGNIRAALAGQAGTAIIRELP